MDKARRLSVSRHYLFAPGQILHRIFFCIHIFCAFYFFWNIDSTTGTPDVPKENGYASAKEKVRHPRLPTSLPTAYSNSFAKTLNCCVSNQLCSGFFVINISLHVQSILFVLQFDLKAWDFFLPGALTCERDEGLSSLPFSLSHASSPTPSLLLLP